jgi:tetratricopeptide (TPR) repeat protein
LARGALIAVIALAACSPPSEQTRSQDVPAPADWSLVAPEARRPIEEAIERCRREPGSAAALAALGRVYHGNHAAALAAAAYERALALDSSDVRTTYFLALLREETGDSAGALALLDRARRLDGSYPPIPFHAGLVLLESGRAAEAVAAFREALRLDGDDVAFHVGLARALRQTGALPEALEAVREALDRDPDHAAANQVAALILKAQGRADSASRHVARGRTYHADIVKDPWFRDVQALAASAAGLMVRAEIFLENGKPEGAVRILEPLAAAQLPRPDVLRKLARALVLSGQMPRARDVWRRAVDAEPSDARTRADLASVLLDLGELDAAAREGAAALALDPSLADARVVLAAVRLRKGDPRGALAEVTPVTESRPDLVLAHVVRGDALLMLRRAPEAAGAFEAALRVSPGLEYARSRLAEARAAAGRPDTR